jgi:hypothetical protein
MRLSCLNTMRMGRAIPKRRIFPIILGRVITQMSCNVSFIVVKALNNKTKVLFLFNATRFPEKVMGRFPGFRVCPSDKIVWKWVWSTYGMRMTLQSRNTRSKTWPNAIFLSKLSQGVGRDLNPGLRGDKTAINRLSLSKVTKVTVHINNTSNIHFLRVYKFSHFPLTWPDGQFVFLQEKIAVYLRNHTQRSHVYVCGNNIGFF